LILNNTVTDNALCIRSLDTNKEREKTFEKKLYRRILGPVYDSEKENWTILTNKEIYAVVKKPTITKTIRLHILRWFGHVQRMEENRILKGVYEFGNNEAER
jgi:hypothetical protein